MIIFSINGDPLFEDKNSRTIKQCVEEAVKRNINLDFANLENANLSGANLAGARLSNANMTNTNLYRTYCKNADFANTDFTNSNMELIFIEGANFFCAKIKDTNIKTSEVFIPERKF